MNSHQIAGRRQGDREAPLPPADNLIDGQTRPLPSGLTIDLSTHPTNHQLDSQGDLT